MRIITILALTASAAVLPLGAQSAADSAQKTFFTRRDLVYTGVALGASAAVSAFDERIAHWTQSANIQGGTSRHDLARTLTVVNEVPLTLGAVALYGVGRLTGHETIADVGLHTTEALALTVSLAEAIRSPLGRVRPRESQNDAFRFRLGAGFTDFSARSFPSIHAAVAFSAASALVEETRVRNPGAVKFVAPVLYTAAMVPGLTRMYLNQHWASDVVAGTFMGALLGDRVVRYAHSHKRSKLDAGLLGFSVFPDGRGGWVAGAALKR